MNSIIRYCLDEARKKLIEGNEKFESLARNLIERETLDAEEIKMLMAGEILPPMAANKGSKIDRVSDDPVEPTETID